VKVTVKLFATLRRGRDKIVEVDIGKDEPAMVIINKLGIRPEEVAILLRNGINIKFEENLNENDVIAIFPPIGGG